jgi:hypothetical protein
MNRKKNCVRPVHTAPKKGRNYQIPVGLAALRAFNYYQPNKESCYEKDITKAFLKSARDDRESYAKELCNHQARDNPHIAFGNTFLSVEQCAPASHNFSSDSLWMLQKVTSYPGMGIPVSVLSQWLLRMRNTTSAISREGTTYTSGV